MLERRINLNYKCDPDRSNESESESHSLVSDSLQPHGLYSPWNFPGQNTGVGSHSLLQGVFPPHGSNPALLHCRQILYCLSQYCWLSIVVVSLKYWDLTWGWWAGRSESAPRKNDLLRLVHIYNRILLSNKKKCI